MARRFVDPFFPNRPVDDPDRFSGREQQVEEVVDALFQTAHDNPKHALISGDRGIGKSSLLLQAKLLATGDNRLAERLKIDMNPLERFDFLVAWHDADSDQDAYSLASSLIEEIKSKVKSFLSGVQIEFNWFLTVKERDSETKPSIARLAKEFCLEVEKVSKSLKKAGKHGLLLFVDEVDRLPPECGAASFFKLSAERLAREGLKNVAFVTAGITGAIPKLKTDHPSVEPSFPHFSFLI